MVSSGAKIYKLGVQFTPLLNIVKVANFKVLAALPTSSVHRLALVAPTTGCKYYSHFTYISIT